MKTNLNLQNGKSVAEAVQARRSIKHFDPSHVMSEEEIHFLLEHTLLSPTAFNIQHWRFLQLQDPELRKAVREASWNQPQITDASLVVVLCMDLKAWDREPQRYWRQAPPHVRDNIVNDIRRSYENNAIGARDEAMRSCSLAAMTLMLLAESIGYQSCPMGGFDYEKVSKLIQLPPDHEICFIVTIGKALQEAHPRGGQIALDELYYRDRFPPA